MVQRLQIAIKTEAVAALLRSAEIVRNESGAWTLILDLDGDIPVDETRALHVVAQVRVRGRQKGRARQNRRDK